MKLEGSNFSGKKISILGAGRSGVACANLLHSLGAKVFLSEIKKNAEIKNLAELNGGIETEFGGHSKRVLDCDLLIPSPGISTNLSVLCEAKQKKIPLLSELEVACRLIQPKILIGITGTNGKSTTTALVGEIFRLAGKKTVVAGNIGFPLSAAVRKIDSETAVVLEVSSYQLELIEHFHPHLAVILNITPDHLERHRTMGNYLQAKARIYENQTRDDFCIFNADDEHCQKLAENCPSQAIFFSRQKELDQGIFFSGKNIAVTLSPYHLITLSPALKIPGPHNLENALAAIAVALSAGIKPKEIVQGLNTFPGLEHRLELVAEIDGVKFVNDSKATNPDSVVVALKSFGEKILLIMGGRDKGTPYSLLFPLVREKVKTIFTIGEAEEKIVSEFEGITKVIRCHTLDRAVEEAARFASSGEIVLLSPACASFDQFEDFEHRGRVFKELVQKIKNGKGK